MAAQDLSPLDLSDHEQEQLQQAMMQIDMAQTQKLFFRVAQLAFKDVLEKSESKCVESVVTKYVAHHQRVASRITELMQQQQMAAQQGQPPQ